MLPLTIAIGADHGGFSDKSKLSQFLRKRGHRVIDLGASTGEASDYPIFGFRVAEAVARHQADLGVLLCKSGNGMAIAANKVAGIRAAVAHNAALARLAREHNHANVLVMGSEHLDEPAEAVLEAFLGASAEDGRHARRVGIIKDYDRVHASGLPAFRLAAYGQSPWIDDISDEMIASGELERMIAEEGVRGLTSNPSIFEKAIGGGKGRYPSELAKLKAAGASAEAAYEKLTTEDIAAAADALRPLYDATGGDDGFVSLEVLPAYAYDEETSVKEAERLFKLLNRPNVMIKVPGTVEGIRAFKRLTAMGVNVNVTLIFSRKFYNDIARAYIAGLTERLNKGEDVAGPRSVASVFVSRIDSAIDKALSDLRSKTTDGKKQTLMDELLHRIAIDNTRLIYDDFRSIFYGAEFAYLAAAGAAPQRPLWGSTSTKNRQLPDTLYVDELIGPLTVNTIPTATFKAFNDHGHPRPASLCDDLEGARRRLDQLGDLGIDLEAVCADLQSAGVQAFADSFDKLFATIQKALG